MTGRLLSFGHGYSARGVAQLLVSDGWDVLGTTRSRDNFEMIRASGVSPLLFTKNDLSGVLEGVTHLLISAAPDADGDPVLNLLGDEIAKRRGQFEWVGYLSTTGVYGDHQGGWVDEATPLTPSTMRGKYRVAAEIAWQEMGLPLHIFRLAGIYGPGRGPFSKVKSGKARRIIKEGQVFSRIHVADIAQTILASIDKPNAGAVYNVCDNFAAPPEDVIAYAAELLGLPVPKDDDFETADMTPMARSFYSESKRVKNDRVKNDLGISLIYPDYKAGLRALLADAT
ncbi:MAG: NAD(P)-dependent oxidoreductase [Rhodobacteraceae bacterium]|nr:MAG: NAD(P)-dependent oxidoreductase [Paracoccaceae bacterium]